MTPLVRDRRRVAPPAVLETSETRGRGRGGSEGDTCRRGGGRTRRRPTLIDNIPRGSPTESQASSNESWRQALFGGGRSCSPRSGVHEEHDEMGGGPIVDDEQGLGLHLGEGACQEEQQEEEEEAVEGMNVKDLKAKAMELGIPTGGRKGQLKARIKHKLSASRPSSEEPPAAATAAQPETPQLGEEVAQALADGEASAVDGSEENASASAVVEDSDTSSVTVSASWDAGTGGQEGEGRNGGARPSIESGGGVTDQNEAAREGKGTTPGDGPAPSLVAVAAPPAEEDEVPASGDDDSAGPLPPGVAAVRPPEDGGGALHPPVEAGGDEEMGEPAGGAAGVQAEEGGTLEHGGEGAADAQGGVARGQQEGIVREEMVVDSVPAVVGPTPSLRESLGSAGAVSTGPGSDAEEESGGGITAAAAAAVASGSTAPGDGGVKSADSSGGVVAFGGRAEARLSALESDDGEDVVEPEPVEDDDEMTEGYAVGEGLVEESGGVDGAGEESGVRYREVEGGREVGGDRDRLGGKEEDGGSGGEGGDGQRGEEEEEAGFDSEEESLISSAAAGEPVTAVSCPAETEQGGAAGQSGVEEGAGDSGEEEEEVVPTAEELTEKYLEVERLWRPILLNPGLAGGGGGGTNTLLPKGELLLETEAFKEKARVLAAWFHPDADPADRRCSKSSAASSVDRSKSGRGVGGSAGGGGRGAGGATAAAARKAAGVVGAGVKASTTTQGYRSAATGTPAMARSRRGSTASTSGASSRPSESSGGGSKGRPGKARGSGQRLSVSPPRARVSAAAAARAGASRRPSGGKGMPPAAKTSSTAAPPSSLRKRNPLIRASLSSPRPPRASVSRPTPEEGVAKRHVATRRSGGSVAGSAAGRLKGAPSGDTAVTKTPARSEMLRSRKASVVGGNSAGKVPASKHTSPGFFSSSKARRGSVATQEGSATSINSNRVQDSRRAVGNPGSVGKGGGTPTGEGGRGGGGTPGSGSRPALQVFGFDPAVSTSPRDARGIPNTSSPEGVGDTRLLSPYHHPVIMRSLEEAALTTGRGAADVPPVASVQ
ncbi:hypothetical protein Esi_0065_0063 [Ectocarpus siliculosus]|uniref:SAP domain-containing protein n=1 Tax=Ectocarpus siliculosus TaxID=2880 RepID=D7G5I1_ECTSI|nr:hypothetical protein Esi_0065_0063 [Ectocarpus siliculosus]|eukprot:CBJ27304.1 hypothetical protein Esi_0065_0063 [Ectocarpus siliculosus]